MNRRPDDDSEPTTFIRAVVRALPMSMSIKGVAGEAAAATAALL